MNKPNIPVMKRLAQVVMILCCQFLILLISAGTIQWLWAWVFVGCNVLLMVINLLVLPRELISERGQPKDNVKKWDKIITQSMIIPMISIYVVSGLDRRFLWTGTIFLWLHLLGVILFLSGSALFTWAMTANRFFSTMVRIQDDRDHTVASGGPYQIVRHPGYVGFILQTLATPLLLGAFWAFIPAGLAGGLLMVRTAFEDATLQKELTGYQKYAEKVRYRLIPGVW